ncbi:MAG: hypothetical protein HY655_07035 [Acidobacteria bacterium]|nr:hypothetical protein [Acidobacteriota bacterium]
MVRLSYAIAAAALLSLSAGSCSGESGPAAPTTRTVTVRFLYRAATAPRTDLQPSQRECAAAVGRTHIHPSWRAFDRIELNPVGAGEIDPLIDRVQRFVTVAHVRRPVDRARILSTIAVLQATHGEPENLSELVEQHCIAQRGVALRAGIHTGECEMTGATLEGAPITIATELAAAASAGSVLVTRTITDLVVGSPFRFKRCGKGPHGPAGGWSMYEVVADGHT